MSKSDNRGAAPRALIGERPVKRYRKSIFDTGPVILLQTPLEEAATLSRALEKESAKEAVTNGKGSSTTQSDRD